MYVRMCVCMNLCTSERVRVCTFSLRFAFSFRFLPASLILLTQQWLQKFLKGHGSNSVFLS